MEESKEARLGKLTGPKSRGRREGSTKMVRRGNAVLTKVEGRSVTVEEKEQGAYDTLRREIGRLQH